MANDFKSKEPTKAERAIYELAMRQEMQDRSLMTNSALLVSLGILLDVKPEDMAEMLINKNDKIKEYSTKINEIIDKLEKEKHKEHGHNHEGHDHHDHEHQDESPKAE
jgi:ABC-type Zn2+ transport system substrate-binding protein/surface adhesin